MYTEMGPRSYVILSTFRISIGYNDNLLTAQYVHFDLGVLVDKI
jgi:hypothetical protein